MASVLRNIINERIYRRRDKILGHAISSPYLKTVGGQSVYVVDVVVRSDAEILQAVPIAANNRQIRAFVEENTPVELQRNNVGQFYVSGLSDTQKGNVIEKTYSLVDAGLAYTDGWRLNGSGNFETGNENEVEEGTPATVTYSYSTQLIPYDELTYGVSVYGAKRLIRTPSS